MKKVLILAMSLRIGGAEKALVNLLHSLDYSRWDIDLLLFQKRGAFFGQIPESVHVLNDIWQIDVLYQSFHETFRESDIPRLGSAVLSAKRYFYTARSAAKYRQFDQMRIQRWIRYYRKLIPDLDKQYDLAIAYAGGETLYYMVDKVEAKRKIAFYHSDYSKIELDRQLEEKYLEQVDAVATISDICKNSLIRLFPAQTHKISVQPNLISPAVVRTLSDAFYPQEFLSVRVKTVFISVGRLERVKGFDLAIRAAERLKKNGESFVWFVIGEGRERKSLESQIAKSGLQNEFRLLGTRINPYPYLKHADIVVQPSRFEGKSVVLDEAKILCKPIVATDYHSVSDQISRMETGVITPMTADGLAEGIEKLLSDPALRKRIVENLSALKINVQDQVLKFERFAEGN